MPARTEAVMTSAEEAVRSQRMTFSCAFALA